MTLGGLLYFGHTSSRCFGHTKICYFPAPTENGRLSATGYSSGFSPIPIARQKTIPKGVLKAVLSDDVTLKLAEHINSDMEVRHVFLISGKRNKQHVVQEMLLATNEYLIPSQVTKAKLCKWIVECIVEYDVEWEKEVSTEEKDGGSKKSGQDNLADDSHKLAWVHLMREARALTVTVEDRPGSAQKKKKALFNGLMGRIITPSLSALLPSIAGKSLATSRRLHRRPWGPPLRLLRAPWHRNSGTEGCKRPAARRVCVQAGPTDGLRENSSLSLSLSLSLSQSLSFFPSFPLSPSPSLSLLSLSFSCALSPSLPLPLPLSFFLSFSLSQPLPNPPIQQHGTTHWGNV